MVATPDAGTPADPGPRSVGGPSSRGGSPPAGAPASGAGGSTSDGGSPFAGGSPSAGDSPSEQDVPPGWEGWVSTAREGPLEGRRWRVASRDAAGPPVIVLHELFGPDEHTMSFASWLGEQGDPPFSIHVPAFFGQHGASSGLAGGLWNLCIRREFNLWRAGRTSRVVTWLRQLVDEVAERHGGAPRVGVVGMCMTGGVVMALVEHPRVGAVVASQPSLPIYRAWSTRSHLGLAEDDVPPLDDPGADVSVLHYDRDWRCPRGRVETMAGAPLGTPETVGPGLVLEQGRRGRLVTVAGRKHSVLTADLSRTARALVGEWLVDALSEADGDA